MSERAYVQLDQLEPEDLGKLDEAEFRYVVDCDLRRNAQSPRIRQQTVPAWISEALRTQYVERWVTALRTMLASVEGQIELRRATGDAHPTGPLRFRAALREALPEAERLLEGRVQLLESAIRAHKRGTETDTTIEPAPIDRALWSLLDD
jgi:hypothetical protein